MSNMANGLWDVLVAYSKSNRKNYEVKSHVVLDKKNPKNLEKAYVVVMLRDPKKMIRDSKGKWKQDKRWQFAFKTKMKCLYLKEYDTTKHVGWLRYEVIKKHKVSFKANSKEHEKFKQFASGYKICSTIEASLYQAFRVATARLLEMDKKEVHDTIA